MSSVKTTLVTVCRIVCFLQLGLLVKIFRRCIQSFHKCKISVVSVVLALILLSLRHQPCIRRMEFSWFFTRAKDHPVWVVHLIQASRLAQCTDNKYKQSSYLKPFFVILKNITLPRECAVASQNYNICHRMTVRCDAPVFTLPSHFYWLLVTGDKLNLTHSLCNMKKLLLCYRNHNKPENHSISNNGRLKHIYTSWACTRPYNKKKNRGPHTFCTLFLHLSCPSSNYFTYS